jgi:hypothetical protein
VPNLSGLLESSLFVERLSRARDFYQQVVGLEKLRESEAGCVFVVAKGQLLLLISREKARIPSKTPGGEVPPWPVVRARSWERGTSRSLSPQPNWMRGGLAYRARAWRC